MTLPLSTPLAQSYASPIDAVCRTLAHHAALNRLLAPVLGQLGTRLRRMLPRLDRLALRWQAGRNLTPRPPRKRPAGPRPAPPATPFAGVRLPGRRAWLLHLCPHASFGISTVERMLADPEIAALAAAAPQTGRLLRPLCRMYGIAPPAWLALPRRPRKPRPRAEPKPRLRLRPIGFTRAQIDRMSAADLTAVYGRLPPHFPLPIPNLTHIRRKIAAG